jgi:hypothetical protein
MRDALKCSYANSLYVVDNLRLLVSSLEARGIKLTEDESAFSDAAYNSLGDMQQAIESVVPLSELV